MSVLQYGAEYKPSTAAAATAVVWGAVPTAGAVNVASTNFNIGVDQTPIAGTLVVTPASNKPGTFSPATVSLTTGSPTATVTFTPTQSGVHTISLTNNGGLTNPATKPYTVQPAVTVRLVASPIDATPQINLTNLHWNSSDTVDQGVSSTITDFGILGSSNGSGDLTVALPNSTTVYPGNVEFRLTDATGVTVGMAKVPVT